MANVGSAAPPFRRGKDHVMAAQPIIRIATSLGRRVRRRVAFLACGATLAIALAAAPVGAQLPLGGPIGPNQVFGALVNGSTGYPSPATIRMACFGPIRPGQTGHPLPGQTVEVFQPEVIVGHFGYTGASQPGRPGKQGPFESRLVHHAQWSPQRSDGARVTDMSGFQKGGDTRGHVSPRYARPNSLSFFRSPSSAGQARHSERRRHRRGWGCVSATCRRRWTTSSRTARSAWPRRTPSVARSSGERRAGR